MSLLPFEPSPQVLRCNLRAPHRVGNVDGGRSRICNARGQADARIGGTRPSAYIKSGKRFTHKTSYLKHPVI
jgi:hypothetical protein